MQEVITVIQQVLQDCQIDLMKYPSGYTWKCLVESYLRHDGMQVGQVLDPMGF